MRDPALANGSVIGYPYLWKWQHVRGETEGRKLRPACLVLRIPKAGKTHLVLLAISGTPPRSDQTALPIPPLERQRAGLKDFKEAWITVSEYNYDIAEESFYFDSGAEALGKFGPSFLSKIAAAAKPFIAKRSAQVQRFDAS
jgi:hypothetical protein